MKFGATWRRCVAELPDALQPSCIPYAAWKKRTKQGAAWSPGVAAELYSACARVDRALLWRPPSRDWWWWWCLAAPVVTRADVQPSDLLSFARLNRETVRKLCKRIDKRRLQKKAEDCDGGDGGGDSGASAWLAAYVRAHTFAFLGGAAIARLELHLGRRVELECPVCLEAYEARGARSLLVLACGHAMCLRCALHMIDADRIYGTLHNVVEYARGRWPRKCVCPICRDKYAFAGIDAKFSIVAPPGPQARACAPTEIILPL